MSARRRPAVTIATSAPEDEGLIAGPVPATSGLLDGRRHLPASGRKAESRADTGPTVEPGMP